MLLALTYSASLADAQVAIRGEKIYTMAGAPIEDGMIVIRDGNIAAIGQAASIQVPQGYEVLQAKVVTPGLIDAHCTVGLSGIMNVDQDQDQLERSAPVQPELRALDAYNAHEELVDWVRSFGITTMHTGHAPGELISGQTLVVKTAGNTVDAAKLVETRAVAATLSDVARKQGEKSPGTRGKMMSMLRAEFIKAQEYQRKITASESDDEQSPPPRELRLETLAKVLAHELPLMITAHKAQDISNALRLAQEFGFTLWLDGAAEAYLLVDEIKAAGVPVILHPSMARPVGDLENMSFETAAKLVQAGVPVAMQAGYEAYVPKTRVVLFEAAMTAGNGLSFEQALATITSDAAKILGIDEQVGSLEVGKHGDVALYDGDPFEYTTHCIGTVINGQVVSREQH
jgi:imidazolonepropionase-like amidohydrolase